MEGPTSVSKTFVVEVLDLCPQRIAGVISYNTQYAHNEDDDDDDDDDDDNGDDYDDDDDDNTHHRSMSDDDDNIHTYIPQLVS